MPRYLSWTKINTALWDMKLRKDDYLRYYILGETKETNPAMAYGSKISKALEWGDSSGDKRLDKILKQVPLLEHTEQEVDIEFAADGETIPIMIQMDTAQKDLTAFKEFKSGKRWTQKDVDLCDQITFYSFVIWRKTGLIPKDIELVNLPTETLPDGRIQATGEVITFKTARNYQHMTKMMLDITKAWRFIRDLEARYNHE